MRVDPWRPACSVISNAAAPFGAVKQSGVRREVVPIRVEQAAGGGWLQPVPPGCYPATLVPAEVLEAVV